MSRVRAVIAKELLDVARNRSVLLPAIVSTAVFLLIPVAVCVIVPAATGHALSEDADLVHAATTALGEAPNLTENGLVELFVFQQFLTLFLLLPITGAMALAAHAIIGEKQARTLEPLLASPLTTFELLVAKVLGALVPTLVISLVGFLLYLAIIAGSAEAGVIAAMVTPRTLALVFGVGPACALVALQLAIVVSSRVNDPRTAQQFGVLIIIPITAALMAQFAGALWLSAPLLGFIALGCFGVWIILAVMSVSLFQRERILTRWR